jgi:hypothetical protein
MNTSVAAFPMVARSAAFQSIAFGGLVAGTLDGLDAILFFEFTKGVPAYRIFQHIASGLLGRSAFQGGWKTVVLGVGLHFLIATGAAATYYLASQILPGLLRRPFVYGPLFGLAVFAFMYRVVVPLSAVTQSTRPMSALEFADEVLVHAFFVGLPIALIARRAAKA